MILTRNKNNYVQLAELATGNDIVAYQAAGTPIWFHDLEDALAQEARLPSILRLAIDEAADWHREQVYEKEPFIPYILHCWEVSQTLQAFVDHPTMEELIAAWHHDLFEDTAYPHAKYENTYGQEPMQLVQACTGHGHNRKTRQDAIHQQLLAYPRAINIKLADRAVNMGYAKNNPKLGPTYAKEAPRWDELLLLSNAPRLVAHWEKKRDFLPGYPMAAMACPTLG